MDISFIILTWNSFDHIKKCLESLNASMKKSTLKYEIFIIDNGSVDDTPSFLEQQNQLLPHVIKPIYLEENKGTTYSRNLAIKEAEGNTIVVLDSDVEVFEGTLEKLTELLSSDNNIGLVAPKLVYGSGTLQKSTDNFPTFWNKALRYFFLKTIEKREHLTSSDDEVRSVDYAISAFWVIRRDVINKVGMLDENIF